MIGIYCIEVAGSGKAYIGSSVDINKRIAEHKRKLKKGTHPNPILSNVIKKYGIDNFKHTIIEETALNILREREQYYIDTLKPYCNVCRVVKKPGIRRSVEEVETILRDYVGGLNRPQVMGKYGMSKNTFIRMVNGHTFKSLNINKELRAEARVKSQKALSDFNKIDKTKYSDKLVREIHKELHSGLSLRKAKKLYSINYSTLFQIRNRQNRFCEILKNT